MPSKRDALQIYIDNHEYYCLYTIDDDLVMMMMMMMMIMMMMICTLYAKHYIDIQHTRPLCLPDATQARIENRRKYM